MTVLDRQRDLTGTLIGVLEAATGRRIYDYAVPRTEETHALDLDHPYGLLRVVTMSSYGGPGLVAPNADAAVMYQVDGISDQRHRAEWLLDRARSIILGRNATGAFATAINMGGGWAINDRRPVAGSFGVDRNGQIYQARERFLLLTTPE